MLRASHRNRLIFTLSIVLVFSYIFTFSKHTPRPIVDTETSWFASDLIYLMTFISAWNSGEIDNPYDYEEQLKVFREEFKFQGTTLMPFAWSPTSLLIFKNVSQSFPSNQVGVEQSFNIVGLVLAALTFIYALNAIEKNRNIFLLIALVFLFFSSASLVSNMRSCQTGLYGFSFISLIFLTSFQSQHKPVFRYISVSIQVILLILCSIKATYLVIATCLLLLFKSYLTLLITALLICILPVLEPRLLSLTMVKDWYTAVSFYSHPKFDLWKSPGTMAVFKSSSVVRVVAAELLGRDLWTFGKVLSLLSTAAMLLVSLQEVVTKKAWDKPLSATIIIALFLVFSPYLGFHDEVLIFIPVLIVLASCKINTPLSFIIVILSAICLNLEPFPVVRFLAKLALIAVCFRLLLTARSKNVVC